jgi:hypothetical protein
MASIPVKNIKDLSGAFNSLIIRRRHFSHASRRKGGAMSYKEAEREEMKEQNDELQDVEQFEMEEDEEEE